METCDPVDTPMVKKSKLDEDPQGKAVDPTCYRGMIGTLMYPTSSRRDLVFVVYICARYHSKPTVKHFHVMLTMLVAKIPEEVHLEEQVENGVVELYFIRTEYQLSELFTKALGRERLYFLIKKLGMRKSVCVLLNLFCLEKLILRTPRASRHLLSLQKSLKSLCSSSGTLLRRSKTQNLMIDFAELPDDETTLTFFLDLGYKGPLHKHPSMENFNYPELIWEDFAFQVDHRMEKKSRHETMPFPKFTKFIINHFLSQHKSLYKLKFQHYHIIKDDGVVSRLKFVRIGKDYQEYGLPILETMLTEEIMQSKRVVKKKVIISTDDNIIPEPNIALELGKSMSLNKAVEEEATRQVHATHARIVTETVLKPTRRRQSGIAFRDTSSVTKKISLDPSKKVKGVQTLTLKEQLAADIMKALKESMKTTKR
ncbi:hypothetical protein Tco_1219679 [Tanacetum coccineum]